MIKLHVSKAAPITWRGEKFTAVTCLRLKDFFHGTMLTFLSNKRVITEQALLKTHCSEAEGASSTLTSYLSVTDAIKI